MCVNPISPIQFNPSFQLGWNTSSSIQLDPDESVNTALCDKIIDILDQTPGNGLSEELKKHRLTAKIVLKQLDTEIREGKRSLTPSILGKALSLITESREYTDLAYYFKRAILDYSVSKKAFVETIEQCYVLNERIAIQTLQCVMCKDSNINGFNSSDLKRIRDAIVIHGTSSEMLLRFVFSQIKILIKSKDEDAAINFINDFPEFAQHDFKVDDQKPLVLTAIENNCLKVAKHLLHMDSSLVKDQFGANILDYVMAYKTYDILDCINPVPVSPIEEAKWLANVWGLDGITTFGDVSANCAGFLGQKAVTRIARSALAYLYRWELNQSQTSEESHPLKRMNFKSITNSLDALYRKKETLTAIQLNLPTIIKACWKDHSAYVFFGRNNRVMKCNRGSECGVSGVRIYKSESDDDIMLEYAHNELKTTNKFMNSTSFDQDLQLTHLRDVVQKKQPIGNCPSESGKAAVYALFIDEAFETYSDEEKALEKAKFVYKDYTVFMRMRALKDYLEQSKHYDISLLSRIKEKAIDLERRKDLWKGQSAEILALFKENNITKI